MSICAICNKETPIDVKITGYADDGNTETKVICVPCAKEHGVITEAVATDLLGFLKHIDN